MTTYFRLHPEDEEAAACLKPEEQVSQPWGGADLGPCDKCDATGQVDGYGECPACKGTGEITETKRRGPTRIVRVEDLDRPRIDELRSEVYGQA